MNTVYCERFQDIHIAFNPHTEKIFIYRCCYADKNVIASYSLEEWASLDIKSELEKCVNMWPENARNITSSCPPEIKECSYNKPLSLRAIEVGVDYSCNAKCTWCFASKSYKTFREKKLQNQVRDVYYQTLDRILSFPPNSLYSIRLTDRGEPFFWKEHLSNFLSKLASLNEKPFEHLFITTNGTMLTDDIIDKLKNCGVKVMCYVSVNSTNEEMHVKTMGIPGFNKIMSFWPMLKSVCTDLVFSYVYSSKKDLEDLINFFPFFIENKQPFIFISESHSDELLSPESKELEDRLGELVNSSGLSRGFIRRNN